MVRTIEDVKLEEAAGGIPFISCLINGHDAIIGLEQKWVSIGGVRLGGRYDWESDPEFVFIVPIQPWPGGLERPLVLKGTTNDYRVTRLAAWLADLEWDDIGKYLGPLDPATL